ncbi:MAG: magnesium transporter CorA family protein [bacterium]|nr:magnesium transporter CorA family protein [bacterium]
MIPSTIHSLKDKHYEWINVVRAGEEELQYLEKLYNLHPLDLKDCLPPIQRPKVVPRPEYGYVFALFVFPLFNPKTCEIEQQEVDFFIMKDKVITIHDNSFIELRNFFQLLELKPEHRKELMSQPAKFVSQILDELFDSCFPMLFHISNDIDALRAEVLHGCSRETVHEILRLKNNVVTFRKAMQPHRDLLRRLISRLPRYMKLPDEMLYYYDRLTDHTKEIWDHLETYLNAIDAVQDTHTTQLSFRLNEIMQTLTVFSIIIMSLTLFSNLFIIEGVSRPIIGLLYDWWAILGIMIFGTISAIFIFKKKKWL